MSKMRKITAQIVCVLLLLQTVFIPGLFTASAVPAPTDVVNYKVSDYLETIFNCRYGSDGMIGDVVTNNPFTIQYRTLTENLPSIWTTTEQVSSEPWKVYTPAKYNYSTYNSDTVMSDGTKILPEYRYGYYFRNNVNAALFPGFMTPAYAESDVGAGKSWMTITPTRTASSSTEMGIAFMAPYTGTYTLKGLTDEGALSSTGNWWKPVFDADTSINDYTNVGLRITVNGQTVWNDGVTSAYRVVTNKSHCWIPQNTSFTLKAGDLLRVEFVALSQAAADWHNSIISNFLIQLTNATGNTAIRSYPITEYTDSINNALSSGVAHNGGTGYTIGDIATSSPWRVVHQNGRNGAWVTVNPGVDSDHKTAFKYATGEVYIATDGYNAENYPTFGYLIDANGLKSNYISPYVDGDGNYYHAMGYEFTVPSTGKYHLGNPEYDTIRSVTEGCYFRPTSDKEFGLKVVIKHDGVEQTVYNVTFSKKEPAIIPELDMFLEKGDAVRLEISPESNGAMTTEARVSGSFRIDLLEESKFGDDAKLFRFGDFQRELENHRYAQGGNTAGEMVFNTPFTTTTPWSVQRKETEGVGWVEYTPKSTSIASYDLNTVYVNDDDDSELDYPNFAYVKPTAGETFSVDYRGMIAPTHVVMPTTKPDGTTVDAYQKFDMAYTFTAKEAGSYGFGPSVGDEKFELYDLTVPATKKYGVRITINNMLYWPNSNVTGVTVENGWAVVSQGNPVDIPTLLNVNLVKGDSLRVEFTCFEADGSYLYYNRIKGTVEVALMDKAFDGGSERTFELYEYFTHVKASFDQGSSISSSSPWSVQSKIMTKASNANTYAISKDWYDFGTKHWIENPGQISQAYYVTDELSGNYPGFNFLYEPNYTQAGLNKRWAAVSPTRINNSDGSQTRTDVAYAFTAPVDGEYKLNVADQDKMYGDVASTPKNKFAQRETTGQQAGVRITINGRVVWNGGESATKDDEGFAKFGVGAAGIDVPTLNSIGLKKGDVLRIEFTNYGGENSFQTRIYGLADISLKTPVTGKYYLSDYSDSLFNNYAKSGSGNEMVKTANQMLVASSGSAWSSGWYGLPNIRDEYTGTTYTGNTKTWNEFTHLTTDSWGIFAGTVKQAAGTFPNPGFQAQGNFLQLRPAVGSTAETPVASIFTAPESGLYTFKVTDKYTGTDPRVVKFNSTKYVTKDAYVRIVKDGVTLWPTAGGWATVPGDADTETDNTGVAIPTIPNIAMEKGDTLRVEVYSPDGVCVWGAPMMEKTGSFTTENAPLKNYDVLKENYFDATYRANEHNVLRAGGLATFDNVPINTDARFSLWGATKDGTVTIKFAEKYQLALGNGTYKLTSLEGDSVEIDFNEPMLGFDGRYDLSISAAKLMNGSTRIGTRYTVILNGEEKCFDVADTTTATTTIHVQNSDKTALTFKNAPVTKLQQQGSTLETLGLGINPSTTDKTVSSYDQNDFWTVKDTDMGKALGLVDRQINRYIRLYETQVSPSGTGLFDDFTFSTDMYIGDLERMYENWWYGGEIVLRDDLQIGFHRAGIWLYAGADEHANTFPFSMIPVADLGYTHDEWSTNWHNVRVTCMDDGFVVYLDGREIYYYDGVAYRVNGNVMNEVPPAEKYVNNKVGKIYLRSESGNVMFANNTLIADLTENTQVPSLPQGSSTNRPAGGGDIHNNVISSTYEGGVKKIQNELFGWANSNWVMEYRNTATNLNWTRMKAASGLNESGNEYTHRFYPQESTAEDFVPDKGKPFDANWPVASYGYYDNKETSESDSSVPLVQTNGMYMYARKDNTADADERVAMSFTAPAMGTYSITCPAVNAYGNSYMIVTLNGKQIWPEKDEPYYIEKGTKYYGFTEIVNRLDKNDVVRFEVWSDGENDKWGSGAIITPKIELVNDLQHEYYGTSVSLIQPFGTEANASLGLNVYYYVGSDNKTLYYTDGAGNEYSLTPTEQQGLQRYQLPLMATRMSENFKFYFKDGAKKIALVTNSVEKYAYKILEEDTTYGWWDDAVLGTGQHDGGKYPAALKQVVTAMLEYGRIAQIYYYVNSTCEHPGYGICTGDANEAEHVGKYPTSRLETILSYDQENKVEYKLSTEALRNSLHVWSEQGNQYIGTAPKDGYATNYKVEGDTVKGSDGNPVYLYGTSLSLKSNVSLKVYLQGTWDGTETVEVKCLTDGVSYSAGNLTQYTKNIKFVEISGISAIDLDKRYEIKVMRGSEQVSNTIYASPMGYVSRVLDTYNFDGCMGIGGHGVSNNLRDLLLRLTDFHIKSAHYFKVWNAISNYEASKAATAVETA